MDNYKTYTQKPEKGILEADLAEFLKKKEKKFPGKVKVGKTIWKIFKSRYDINSRYEILTVEHIFAKCSSEELAYDIEKMCQQYLNGNGRLIRETDKSEGGCRGNEDQTCAVYLTKLKDNLYVCPVPNCRFTTSKEIVEQHMLCHQQIIDSMEANKLLASLDSSHRISVDPIQFEYDKYDSEVCRYCGKSFSTNHIRAKHERFNCENNRQKYEQCDECGRMVNHKDMSNHIRNYHKHLNRKICDLCGKKLAYTSLEFHMRMHMGTQMVQCPQCPKKITYMTLKNHIKLIHSEKPRPPKNLHTCDVCGKKVINLRAHMDTHKEKVQCNMCKKWYTFKTLPAHKRLVHVNEIISCPFEGCDKKGNKEYMRNHKITHNPKIMCQVKQCKTEMQKSNYRKHMLKFHPEEWKEQAAKKK